MEPPPASSEALARTLVAVTTAVRPGGGHRIHGRSLGKHHSSLARRARKHTASSGYHYLHTALNDHSRLANTEVLPDEQAATAAAFWCRAVI